MFFEPGLSFWETMTLLLPITLLSLISHHLRILDSRATVLAVAAGLLIGVYGDVSWLILLLFFLIISFMVTKFRFSRKHATGTSEGNRGTRRSSNVFYNGLVPILVAVVSSLIGDDAAWLYITAIAAAASDTSASEIGVLSDRVYMITNRSRNSFTANPAMRISPGVDGGVSILGTTAAFTAALLISLVGWVLIPWMTDIPRTLPLLVLPALLGFLGCHIDSLLGATLEARKLINKGQVNLTEITLSTLIMYGFLQIL